MRKFKALLIFFVLQQSILFAQENIVYGIDIAEATAIFNYLQNVRQKNIAKSDPMYKYVKNQDKLPLLVWNDTLAEVARTKAKYMADHNHFDHVDLLGKGINYYISKAGYELDENWLDDPKNNYFESLQAGYSSGVGAVQYLIIDKGVPGHGHRKHLLGQDDWNFKNVDIGAAFYRVYPNSRADYSTYTVIIIARHHY